MVGRPSKYDPAFCELVIKCGEEGDTLAAMAEACDVDRSTLNDWVEQHEEFSRAVSRGLQKAQAWWEKQGRKATFGGTDGFNATSFIFNMKNRFKEDWRDKVDLAHGNPDGTAITFNTVYERRPGDGD
jgi:hypothetical protein